MKEIQSKRFRMVALVLAMSLPIGFNGPSAAEARLSAQATQTGTDKPFVVEYYYKAKWGHADEFITL